MSAIIILYGISLIVLIVLAIVSWLVWDRRFKTRHGQQVPTGFIRTSEVSYDPGTHKRFVVYYHPSTGERYYKEEPGQADIDEPR